MRTISPRLRAATFPSAVAIAFNLLLAAIIASAAAPVAAQSQGASIEGCIGCHALGEPVQVGNINQLVDRHYTDLDPSGPATPSGFRQINVTPYRVDVTGTATIVEFTATDERGADIETIFDSDGRLVLAKLVDGADPADPDTSGDPTEWQRLVEERFTSGGIFQFLGDGAYRYTANFDPTSVPIAAGDTLRAAIQISASDIPAGNGWCDFDANLGSANDCVSATSITRDIIRTDTCNGCHGVTSDTKLNFHGGGRTEVEYCVTCHNPDRNPETAMTTLIHKIHYGSQLTEEFRGGRYDHVTFTRDIDNCVSCHEAGPVDSSNWKTEPNREACGSCHDDVNFDTGANHGSGGQQLTNRFCSNCHPMEGPLTPSLLPIATVHQGVPLEAEAALYRGTGNGIALESVTFDDPTDTLTVVYSVTRDGVKMALDSDPEWVNGGALNILLGWSTEDYTNEGSGRDPAQPSRFSALDIGGTVTDLGTGSYRTVIDVSSFESGSVTVGIEGHPNADLLGTGTFSRVPVRSVYQAVSLAPRVPVEARRQLIDINKCNQCHDSGGAGLSLHGNNRTGEMQVCVLCHNSNATDINQRPADPASTPDGKSEEAIDMKRMIHRIHMGGDMEEPLVVYGFGGSVHDYAGVEFIGNIANCLTCHVAGGYSADRAWHSGPSTIDTGDDLADPADDLNISPVTAVCSSCHDSEGAKDHMVNNGGSFGSFESEIAIPLPEPGALPLSLTALGALSLMARLRRRDSGRR